MTEQLSLLEAQEARDRLIFVIYPPPDIAAHLPAFVPHGKPHAAERIHITLHHVGDHAGLPEGVVAAAKRAAESLDIPAFDVTFDRVMSFAGKPGNRPFVIAGADGPSAIKSFREALGFAMRKAGLGLWVNFNFTPHMTLLYGGNDLIPERPIQPITWRVCDFVLVNSLLGQGRHVPLGRWRLPSG